MLSNYLITSWRHLTSQKGYAVINILGLAIGMTAVILTGIYVRGKFKIDSFHTRADRICQVLMEIHTTGSDRYVSGGTDGPLAETLKAEYPEVETALRTKITWSMWIRYEDRIFEKPVLYAPPEYFDVFDYEGLDCDPKAALAEPYSILIVEDLIPIYFPEGGDPVGKVLRLDGVDYRGDYTITGVLKRERYNSLRFDFATSTLSPEGIAPQEEIWRPGAQTRGFQTYVLLKDAASRDALEEKIQDVLLRYLGPADAKKHTYLLQPLSRRHLYWGRDYTASGVGEIDRIITFSLVAGFILFIACVNYVNLMTSRASRRAREIGMRKVSGAHRKQLIQQFLGESIVTTLIATIAAAVLARLFFSSYAEIMTWSSLDFLFDLPFAAVLLVTTVVVGILSGLYPAFYLTRVDPAVVVKGEETFTGSTSWGRRVLVVIQFTASIAVIIATFNVRQQVNYMISADLGYKWKNVVEIPILWVSRTIDPSKEKSLTFRYRSVMASFLEHPNVLDAAATRFPQGAYVNQGLHEAEGSSEDWNFGIQDIEANFLAFNGIALLAGRLPRDREEILESGETIYVGTRFEEYILNKTAMEQLGWVTDDPNPYEAAIGRRIGSKGKPLGTLVGVCDDYHARSLHSPYVPIAFNLNPGALKFVQLQLGAGDRAETLDFLKDVWNRYIPDRPFEYLFLETRVQEWNTWNERQLNRILDVSAVLTIFVSCLGLLGLVSYLAETKMKEIGIRKTLGAGTASIVRHLTSDFAKLILIANVIAWPIAWWSIGNWLNNYAFRIEPDILPYFTTGLLAFVAAGLMIGYHTYRAASRNPVDTIRR